MVWVFRSGWRAGRKLSGGRLGPNFSEVERGRRRETNTTRRRPFRRGEWSNLTGEETPASASVPSWMLPGLSAGTCQAGAAPW